MAKIKKNDPYILIDYKIQENLDRVDDLGLMTIEDIRTKILNSKCAKSETKLAVSKLVNEEKFSMYYEEECNHCGFTNYIKEEDPETFETEKKIFRRGFRCKNCVEKNSTSKDSALTRKFCVSHSALNEESSQTNTLFDKIKEFFQWSN